MTSSRVPTLVLSLLALAGCGATSGDYPAASVAPPAPYDYSGSRGAAEIEALVVESAPVAATMERQIVREGWAKIEVDDPQAGAGRVTALIPQPGFIESSERGDEHVRLTMRIPGDRFDVFLASLEDVGDIENIAVSGHDVTEQLVDWQARLDNLIALRDRLRLHMDRAVNVTELVQVERELARVQSEIDSLSGRLQAVRGTVALSRVTVTLEKEKRLGPLGAVFYGVGKALAWLFVIQ